MIGTFDDHRNRCRRLTLQHGRGHLAIQSDKIELIGVWGDDRAGLLTVRSGSGRGVSPKRFSVTFFVVFQGLNQGPGLAVTASRHQQADLIVKLGLTVTHPGGTVIGHLQVGLIIF